MLIEFSVGNFCSFRDRVTLSMVAAKLTSRDKSLDINNVFTLDGQPPLLTSAVVYGANASGKSNLLGAMRFMQNFVIGSSEGTEATGGIGVDPFRLNIRTIQEPSHFEIVFILDGQRYRYGFEATRERVETEWLYTVPKRSESLLFERRQDEVKVGAGFREGRKLADRTRPNALFLSVAAQFNGRVAQNVLGWFKRFGSASGLADMGMRFYTERRLADGLDVGAVVDLVTRLDLGIMNIKIETRPVEDPAFPVDLAEDIRTAFETILRHSRDEGNQAIDVKTVHRMFDDAGQEEGMVEFDLDIDESAGTRKLFAMAGPLIKTLAEGRVLIVDELDSSLHPAMTREIVQLFNSEDTNPHHAQLIFTTQDTSLLSNELLRRDQIWFVDKDRRGSSTLYSLAEFRGVRNDKDYEGGYLEGRYGAVPYVVSLAEAFY